MCKRASGGELFLGWFDGACAIMVFETRIDFGR